MNKIFIAALLLAANLGALALPVAEENNAEALIQEDFPLVEREEAKAAANNDAAPVPEAKDDKAAVVEEEGNAPGVAKCEPSPIRPYPF